jgi:cytoskeletal protein CcmA (bactofilin family)
MNSNASRTPAENKLVFENQFGSVRQIYLDQSSKIEGKMHFEAKARIDGQMQGEILAKDLTIGESADVTAQIKAVSVKVAGSFKGEITASQCVEVLASAKISGNICSPVLIMHEGAAFEGHCAMAGVIEKVRKPSEMSGT